MALYLPFTVIKRQTMEYETFASAKESMLQQTRVLEDGSLYQITRLDSSERSLTLSGEEYMHCKG